MARTGIAVRAAVVTLVATAAVSAFYVRGLEPGITFATQGIDLKIDSKAWYNGSKVSSATWTLKNLVPGSDKFWNFDDIKPGDYGCTVISMHVKKTDSWMCLDFKNLQEDENGANEPEGHEDGTPGPDLANGTNFFGWDDVDGDGKYEPPHERILWNTGPASDVLNDKSYAIGDSRSGGICRENKTRYVGTCWCAGELTVQPGMNKSSGAAVCDPTTLGNEAQTDSFTVDVEIRAEPAYSKPKFLCGGDEVPAPPPPPHCRWCNSPVFITIDNHATTTSTTTSSSDTGGNTAGSGGTVNTGNASATSTSLDIINRFRGRFR